MLPVLIVLVSLVVLVLHSLAAGATVGGLVAGLAALSRWWCGIRKRAAQEVPADSGESSLDVVVDQFRAPETPDRAAGGVVE